MGFEYEIPNTHGNPIKFFLGNGKIGLSNDVDTLLTNDMSNLQLLCGYCNSE